MSYTAPAPHTPAAGQALRAPRTALTALTTLLALSAGGALLLSTPAALAQAPASAAAGQPGCAQVEVHNVRPQQGHLLVAAYGAAESFRKQALTQLRLPAGEATMRFALCGLGSATEVSLVLLQDLDGDGRMATNVLGIPTEPWGASGTPGMMGPSWDNSRVPLNGGVISVRMAS